MGLPTRRAPAARAVQAVGRWTRFEEGIHAGGIAPVGNSVVVAESVGYRYKHQACGSYAASHSFGAQPMVRLGSMRILRTVFLLGITLNLVMIGIRVSLDPQLLGLPGGLRSALEPAAMLALYALIVFWATRCGGPFGQAVIREGTAAGLIAGAIEALQRTVVNFGHLNARVESVSTGVIGSGLLLIWVIAGYRATRGMAGIGAGLLAGSWCAMVEVVIAVTYGFSQLFWGLPRLEDWNIGSPNFERSGWTNPHIFTIADIFRAGFKVLLIAPVAGAVLGGVGVAGL